MNELEYLLMEEVELSNKLQNNIKRQKEIYLQAYMAEREDIKPGDIVTWGRGNRGKILEFVSFGSDRSLFEVRVAILKDDDTEGVQTQLLGTHIKYKKWNNLTR